MSKSIFAFESPAGEIWAYASREVADDARLQKDGPVTKFVELTPRVRLGLWLAEDETRQWSSGGADSEHWIQLEAGENVPLAVGTGPTLDAAIEDAMGKIGGVK